MEYPEHLIASDMLHFPSPDLSAEQLLNRRASHQLRLCSVTAGTFITQVIKIWCKRILSTRIRNFTRFHDHPSLLPNYKRVREQGAKPKQDEKAKVRS